MVESNTQSVQDLHKPVSDTYSIFNKYHNSAGIQK